MQIEVYEVTPPRAANLEKGWAAGKTYKITDTQIFLHTLVSDSRVSLTP